MEFFLFFLFLLVSISILLYEVIAFNKKGIFSKKEELSGSEPFVSILISARNEEENIPHLCHSLTSLSYPKDRFEILIGDDDSDDRSLELLEKHKPSNCTIHSFKGSAKGKLGVLKNLAKLAKGQFQLFTDADVVLNPNWIQGMIYRKQKSSELHVGVTAVMGEHWFYQLQNADWLFNQSVIAWVTNHIGPVTAWGNNMSIDRESFEEVDYSNRIEDTVVEDVELMRSIIKDDGKVCIHASHDTLVRTKPCLTFFGLVQQRSRWLHALRGMPWFAFLGLLLKLTLLPTVLILAFYNPVLLIFWGVKILLGYSIANYTAKRIGRSVSFLSFLYLDIYEFVLYLFTFVHFLFPFRLDWKGRRY